MTAADVKAALYGRHPGGIFQGMLSPGELGQLVRWISVRPDPRHHAPVLSEAVA